MIIFSLLTHEKIEMMDSTSDDLILTDGSIHSAEYETIRETGGIRWQQEAAGGSREEDRADGDGSSSWTGGGCEVVPMGRIELPTSPLPRECSTTEPHGQFAGMQQMERDKRLELSTYTLARYRSTN